MHLEAYMDFWKKIFAKYKNEWLTSFYFEKNDFFFSLKRLTENGL